MEGVTEARMGFWGGRRGGGRGRRVWTGYVWEEEEVWWEGPEGEVGEVLEGRVLSVALPPPVPVAEAAPAPRAEVSDMASLWALCWEVRVVVGERGAVRFVVAGGGEPTGCVAAALVDSEER